MEDATWCNIQNVEIPLAFLFYLVHLKLRKDIKLDILSADIDANKHLSDKAIIILWAY